MINFPLRFHGKYCDFLPLFIELFEAHEVNKMSSFFFLLINASPIDLPLEIKLPFRWVERKKKTLMKGETSGMYQKRLQSTSLFLSLQAFAREIQKLVRHTSERERQPFEKINVRTN